MIGGVSAKAAESGAGCGVREETPGHGSSTADVLQQREGTQSSVCEFSKSYNLFFGIEKI